MATLPLIKVNSTGPAVVTWQTFLIVQHLLNGAADGDFGPATLAATIAFQKQNNLQADGVVGNNTYTAAMPLGLSAIVEQPAGEGGPNWPPKPNFPPLVSNTQRQAIFGAFTYVADPLPDDPEHIKLTGNWQQQNIISVPIPQLKGIPGGASTMQFHKLGANQLIKLWADWASAGLLNFVLTFDGSYNPRFVRGSTTTLSNHSFGSAFDIDASWNAYGTQPALVGNKGSVRQLVEIANNNGFYWGGHFSKPDGMHFEVAKLL
jgi:peptidoglycan hydrolase-like protein with peptidoglycan-binding domain